jgi:5-(carboxyamino)imidazole ribonucleotide mutase
MANAISAMIVLFFQLIFVRLLPPPARTSGFPRPRKPQWRPEAQGRSKKRSIESCATAPRRPASTDRLVDCARSFRFESRHREERVVESESKGARGPGEGTPLVGILMGSASDWETMSQAVEVLRALGVPHEARVLSAHRTPEPTAEYARTAEERGLEVIIAGAGGAAHLAGVVAGLTLLPVLGVPIATPLAGGLDSLLSMVQMPKGVPVGTLAVGRAGAANAGLFAAAILARSRPELRARLAEWRAARAREVLAQELPLA